MNQTVTYYISTPKLWLDLSKGQIKQESQMVAGELNSAKAEWCGNNR